MSGTTMYQRIMNLATQLRQETSVKKRRDLGQELLELLRDDRVRKKLTAEATHRASRRTTMDDTDDDNDEGGEDQQLSVPLRRWYALTQMWRVIILNALVATKKIGAGAKKRVKLTKDDILLPYHLLRLCDQHLPCNEDNLVRAKLHQNEIKELLHYCLDMLSMAQRHVDEEGTSASGRVGGGDDEFAGVAAVEINLLEMMLYLCSRIEHVAHYRPDEDMQTIFGEVVEGRLRYFCAGAPTRKAKMASSSSDDMEKAVMAAKIMDALLTSCQKLGIGLHTFLSNCLHLISRWASQQQQDDLASTSTTSSSSTTIKMIPYMLHSVTILLTSLPEGAIAPMSKCGRPILSLALKYYAKASTGAQKETFHDYFIAHIVMCQVAARLQGFMPGDLGDVGSASLSLRKLDSMLTLVLGELEKMLGESTIHQKQIPSRIKQSGKKKLMTTWHPLSHRQRRHLELGARLLACAQRCYWSKTAFESMADPTQELIDTFFGQTALSQWSSSDGLGDVPTPMTSSKHAKANPASLEDLMASPWVTHVVQPLVNLIPTECLAPNQRTVYSSSSSSAAASSAAAGTISSDESNPPTRTQTTLPIGSSIEHFPLLQHIFQQKQERDSSSIKSMGPLISMITACAEAFASGCCWSSFEPKCWWTIKPKDPLEEDELNVIGCSPHDLSQVLFLVSCALEMQGRQHSDTLVEFQHVVLLCLVKLAHCTAVISIRATQQQDFDLTSVETVWRRIWNILFRSDLRYASFTQNAEPGPSTGELVLILMNEMVRLGCTDLVHKRSVQRSSKKSSSFLSSNQACVWNLPAFSDAGKVESAFLFLLLCSMLQNAGVSDVGTDAIDDAWIKRTFDGASTLAGDNATGRNWRQFGRRSRLIALCMGVLYRLPQLGASQRDKSGKETHFLGPLAASLAALVHGRGIMSESLETFFDNGIDVLALDQCIRTEILSFTSVPARGHSQGTTMDSNTNFYGLLWKLPPMFLLNPPRIDKGSHQCDHVGTTALHLLQYTIAQNDQVNLDFLSSSDSRLLHQFLRKFLLEVIWPRAMASKGEVLDTSQPDQSFDMASLARQTLALKVILTLILSCRKPDVYDDLDLLSGVIESTLNGILSNIQPLCASPDELRGVLTDLLQIFRALTAASLSIGLHFSKAVVDTSSVLADICKKLLLNYAKGRRSGILSNEHSSHRNGAESSSIDFEEEELKVAKSRPVTEPESLPSDTDGEEIVGMKRSKQASERSRRKRRRMPRQESSVTVTIAPPDCVSAGRLASILITLRPSLSNCKLVAECMLRTPLNGSTAGFADEVDLSSLKFCIGILCSQTVILHHEIVRNPESEGDSNFETSNDATLSLCLEIIRLARHESDPSSLFHLIGFDVCALLVQQREKDTRSDPISKRLAKDLTGFLVIGNNRIELRSHKRRPILRTDWFQAATSMFKYSREHFHSVFDHEFRKMLLSSLRDLSESVRKSANLAVGAAFLVLPEQRKIYKRVVDELPPIASSPLNEDFRKWCLQADAEKGESSSVESTVWDDSFLSFRTESILCRAVMAGATSEHSLFREVLFNLIHHLSLNSTVEPLAFQACCKVASMRGYESCEAMLHFECEGLTQQWLEHGESFAQMPLLLSNPNLLRHLLELNLGPKISFAVSSNAVVDFQALKEQAAASFLYRYRDTVVPLAYIQVHATRKPAEALEVDDIYERCMHEVCSMLVGDDLCFDDAKHLLLRNHIQDIAAFCFSLMMKSDEGSKVIGREAFISLKAEVSKENFERFRTERAHLAVRRLLELSGTFEHQIGCFSLSQQGYSNALYAIMKELGGEANKKGDIFGSIGCSATECFLYAMNWLQRVSLPVQKTSFWSSIEIISDFVCSQLRRHDFDGIQLGFCLSIIVEALMRPNLSCLQNMALKTLKKILSEVQQGTKNEILTKEISFVLRRITAVCLFVHETGQKKFLSRCKNQYLESAARKRGCLGFLLLASGTYRCEANGRGIWGWDQAGNDNSNEDSTIRSAVAEYGSRVEARLFDSIVTTYEVLKIVSELVVSLGFSGVRFMNSALLPTVKGSYTSILAEFNKKLCAQDIFTHFFEEEKKRSPESRVDQTMFSGISKAIQNERHSLFTSSLLAADAEFLEGGLDSDSALNCLTPEQRLLWIELTQLALHLEECPSAEGTSEELTTLAQNLIDLCGAPYPEPLRCAAGRCLAELDPLFLQGLATNFFENFLDNSPRKAPLGAKDFMLSIQVRCFELLVSYMKSASSQSALIAMETARSLLATSEGTKAWAQVETYECKALIAPLRSRRSTSSCRLPETNFEEMVAEFSEGENSQLEWCWDDRLWTINSNMSFEFFVKRLVTGLIACCYRKTEANESLSHVKGTSLFFPQCQKLCALEHNFAAAVFPGIVLNLLQNDIYRLRSAGRTLGSSVTEVQAVSSIPSEAVEKISRAFSNLLSRYVNQNSGPDHEVVVLVVESLDLLRRASQTAFVTSKDHKPNTEPSISASVKSSSQPKQLEQPTGTPQWAGIPFDTVLAIDGRLVAQACLRIKRAASALLQLDLYAETRFQGSGAILSRVVDEHDSFLRSKSDTIESKGQTISDGAQIDCTPFRSPQINSSDDALSMLRLLKQSFLQLGEFDNLQVIENHSSELASDATVESASVGVSASSLRELQLLDARFQNSKDQGAASFKVALSLQRLGLGSVLEKYISALVGDRDLWDNLKDDDTKALREKWFEGQLYHGRWNQDAWATIQFMEVPVAADGMTSQANQHGGFHECTYEALSALLRDDVDFCTSSLGSARKALLQESSNVFSNESLFAGLEQVMDQLRATNKIERFALSSDPLEILRRWGLQHSPHEMENIGLSGADPFSVADFTLRAREIVLQIFYSRLPSRALAVEESLKVTHFWQCCSIFRRQGRPDKAGAALERLRSIVCQGNNITEKLRFRLEDAMIMESRGDFAGAIRSAKNLIKSLKALEGHDKKLDLVHQCLLADSLAKCGSWMADYKVEPAKSILESYLLPASTLSNAIVEVNKTFWNAARASTSLLSLAHLASSLHESNLTRIRSTEWKTAGRIMHEREGELQKCEPLVKEAELRHNKLQAQFKVKNQKNQSKEALAAERDFMDLYVYKERLRKELRFLTLERQKMERSVWQHLNMALTSFGNAFALAGTERKGLMHQHVFKMVSLWLANCNQTGDGGEDINSIMQEVFDKVPTFRFVPLTYQIFSRLELENDGPGRSFQEVLKALVFKMCDDHPYQCLVQLIALSNGMKVEVSPGMGTSERTANDFRNNVGDSKSVAASELLKALERHGTAYVTQLVKSYQLLTDAYMQLAMASTTEFHQGARAKKPILISQVCGPKHRLDTCLRSSPKSSTFCPPCVMTKPPPLRPGCDYGEGREDPIGAERIDRFENSFTITETGINRPKVVMCIGSKGGRFRQLVKGQDDIRQDAIMQQVFQYVNDMFICRESQSSASKHSRLLQATSARSNSSRSFQKNLKLVTYHIAPLSPITGVLEWVEDAIPIGDYLNDRGTRGPESAGAHSRYYPGEWATKRCREHLKNAPDDEKRKGFDEICQRHSPCFRFFFIERFGDAPSAWFTAKMKYTRSVAVSSIVGHMLGIGDRHSNNILIHQRTGEVVHIDFGIVFEQGKLLTKPEVVPFRLTRNIVDGMGPCGTEGAFCSAAEATAAALRENSSALLTILSAVVSDPLYKWSISPIKALQRQRTAFQNDEDEDGNANETAIKQLMPGEGSAGSFGFDQRDNEAATQAIARIHEKLQGYEDGTAGEQQSVESQVQLLINCSRDPNNLCVMFEGWAPWS